MLKIKLMYSDSAEKDRLLNNLKEKFNVLQLSKECQGKGKSPYRKIYVSLSSK